MNIRRLLFILASSAVIVAVLFSLRTNSGSDYQPRDKQSTTDNINGAIEYLASIRNNVLTGELDPNEVIRAGRQVDEMPGYRNLNITWEEMGPDNIGGRTRAILIDKDDNDRMYAGGVAGGLWLSTTGGSSWIPINDMARSPAISCIAQSPVNGYIYVGTGEGFASGNGAANGSTGFPGKGIYRSTDGVSFALLASTIPADTNATSGNFRFVNEVAVAPVNSRVFAATETGIWISDDHGVNWSRTKIGNTSDVDIATDGTVVISSGNRFFISSDNGDTWSSPTGSPSATGRIEFAIAPSDPNYIYASCARSDGYVHGIFRSTDKGQTWTTIGPSGSQNFQPFRNQGNYNNTIAVFPNNKDKVIFGGIDLWEWHFGGTPTQVTLWALSPSSSLYIHADHHKYVFHPNYKTASNPNGNEILFVGSDGGISRSIDGANTFHRMNINYNTVQFYTVSASGQGTVIGGTQDNGCIYIDLQGNTPMNGKRVSGGDGGWAMISLINAKAMFTTTYNAGALRSPDLHENPSQFFGGRMLALGTPGDDFPAAFVTPQILWETINYPNPTDSVMYTADKDYLPGEKIIGRSRNNAYPFDYTLSFAIDSGDQMLLPDPIESRYFLGASGSVWMTREILDFSKTPHWMRIANITGTSQCLAASEDGDYLFIGTNGGRLYRVSNLLQAIDSTQADVSAVSNVLTVDLLTLSSGNRAITSIAIDPNDPDRVVVTLGNYGGSTTTYIYYSTNATSASPTFTGRQGVGAGRLPSMPVYASVISKQNPNTVIVGTEYGLFATENINSTASAWEEVNAGAARVPTHFLYQQSRNYGTRVITTWDNGVPVSLVYPGVINYGTIYAGTHGRGIFKTETFTGIGEEPISGGNTGIYADLNIYPNPASDHFTAQLSLSDANPTRIDVYDLSGRLVASQDAGQLSAGDHKLRVSTDGWQNGSYIVRMLSGKNVSTAKLIVSR